MSEPARQPDQRLADLTELLRQSKLSSTHRTNAALKALDTLPALLAELAARKRQLASLREALAAFRANCTCNHAHDAADKALE